MLWNRIARTHRPATRSAVLRLEQVEGRTCPSCTVAAFGNTLFVIGDAANNNVAVVDNGPAGMVVTCDGDTHPAATGIERVLVFTGAGDDTVTYSRSAAGGNFTGRLDFDAFLGSGNDKFTADLNGDDLAGTARVAFDVVGSAGDDAMTFNAGTTAAGVDIASGARLRLDASGGIGADKVTVAFAGKLAGSLGVSAGGGAGGDTVAATVDLAAGSTGSLRGRVNGGDGNDTLTFNITGATANVAVIALLDGGDGTDTCVHTANVTAVNCEA